MNQQPDGPVARFPSGAALGRTEGALNVWRGLPYALPPGGDLRWRPPVPVPDRADLFDATAFGLACPQPLRRRGSVYECHIEEKGDDCLNLNIWAPKDASDLPVFVWIHGGNLLRGAGSEALTDGAALARRGQVVVTINYRLNVHGYLAHPHLSAESPDGVSGNYGLLDQIAALQWVQRNIAAVGGDPDNVTVAGESAGALSVYYLLCAPAARGLFARAIAQSGHICSAQHLKEDRHGMGSGEAAGERLLAALGAISIDDLRRRDPQELSLAADAAGFAAQGVVDGLILPDQPLTLFRTGQTAPVPLLAGWNAREIPTLEFLRPPVPASPAEYERIIRARYGDLADRFLARYPADDPARSGDAAAGDALFGWTVLAAAKAQVANGRPAHVYFFDHGYPEADARDLHAFHAAELPYVFDTMRQSPPAWPKAPDTEEEAALTRIIGDYWTAFTRDGTPTAEGAPDWPPYADRGAILHIADRPLVRRDLFPGMYELVEEDFARRRATGTTPWNWLVGTAAPRPAGADART
ncbi:carboxylic ester hydrolase [Primorskyibacter flagellatus]|uniref:Carboxylic ester hydrolase n=1 Tax=Primorskyibacter flagellatus TaxID=1387277 RepID=A0A917EK07_9RHOB|nr:carboxylesterase family protein [Primorskyibacter flagellatus]GGE51512.1 carboxylic ester hydrolase [Primorskyibacter flagellatus]